MPWYSKDDPGEFMPIPVLGPDLVDVRQLDLIRAEARAAQLEAEDAE